MAAKSFEEVELWRKAHAWVLAVYRFTEQFPKHELFGLTSQLRRAAVSVPANFAEGFKKRGQADKLRFYNIAQGSLERVSLLFHLGQGFKLRRLKRPEENGRGSRQDARQLYARAHFSFLSFIY